MLKYEIYRSIYQVPADTTKVIISPGRQFSLGHNVADANRQQYGLSRMSQLNVIAGAMVAEATKAMLIVTGNEKAGFIKGAERILVGQFPEIHPFLDSNSPTTIASAVNLGPMLKNIVDNYDIVDVVITSDEPQAKRLADMFNDQAVPIRGIAIAHNIVAQSQIPEHQELVGRYLSDKWRYLETAKQIGLRLFDRHGTILEGLAQNARP